MKKITNEGVPQGSCLSPTLFNVYTEKLRMIKNKKCDIYQFADDVTLKMSDKSDQELEYKGFIKNSKNTQATSLIH